MKFQEEVIMDVSLECNVSLSKKLRSIIGDSEGRVVLIVDSVHNGTGQGTLLISGDNLNSNVVRQAIDKETSIQFTPFNIKEEIPSDTPVSAIFATGNLTQQGPRTAVDQIAVTAAPDKNKISHAMKRSEEIATPDAFSETQEPAYQQFVSNIEELMMAIKAAQGKEAEIDPITIEDPRQKAIAIEMKEQAEAIDIPAYVVNDSCSSVTLNDIDLNLNLNMPINLSNISAKRLETSGDLKAMLRSNVIKFIAPNDVDQYRVLAEQGVQKPGLEVYSTRGEAENAIDGDTHVPQAAQIDIPVDDTGPSDQEQLAGLMNLTPMNDTDDGGSRVSYHGEGGSRSQKIVGNDSEANSKGVKTISRA